MKACVRPGGLKGTISAIPSKSHAHRILILSALGNAPTKVRMEEAGEDVAATLGCLNRLGARVIKTQEGVTIHPISAPAVRPILDCGESGTTFRLLLPIAAAFCGSVGFHGRGRLPERPIQDLQAALTAHGVAFDRACLPFTAQGRLTGGLFLLPGDVSSQYVSGLLMALPITAAGGEIKLTTPLASTGYVDMTIAAMALFGVRVIPTGNGFLVPGGQRYVSPGSVNVEGDWSAAAFFLAAGALSGPVSVRGLSLSSLQGDKQIVELLLRFGADASVESDVVTVSSGHKLRGVEIDVGDIPDLAPILAVVAAAARGGKTVLHRTDRLKMKESDRVRGILDLLHSLNVRAEAGPDEIIISGGGRPAGGPVDGKNDHRLVMAGAILATACREGETVLDGARAVDKSYPRFFQDFVKLGGNAHVF